MSGALAIRAALHEALAGDEALLALVNQVSDGTPAKASAPWLMLGEGSATGWGARNVDGLALRQPIRIMLRDDDFSHAMAVLARVETVLAGLDDAVGDWRITSLRLERSRAARGRSGWRIDADFAVRAARIV